MLDVSVFYPHFFFKDNSHSNAIEIILLDDMLYLWSLELCSSKLYTSKKTFKCVIPAKMTDVKDILALGNLIWLYKVSQAWRRWMVL